MENVKVIIWGLGAMGGGMADMLLKKKGVDIVGVAGRGKKIGTSMYDYIKTERGDRPDVIIEAPEDVIRPGAADIVLRGVSSRRRLRLDLGQDHVDLWTNCRQELEEAILRFLQPQSYAKTLARLGDSW